jgi:23S rRNA (guanine745-N1)-methyltransferase
MTIEHILDLLRCPLCTTGFTLVGQAARCDSGHSFDLARQGYLNLLGRAAPAHADTAEMVAARSRFLGGGYFDPMSDTIELAVRESNPTLDRPLQALEVGAGTGHYLARLLSAVGGRGVALDISAAASRRAAQAHPHLGAVVADGWQPLPLRDAAFDVVFSIFAPRHPAEFARVLRPSGVLVVATPLPEHLVELRERLGLLQIDPAKDERLATTLDAAFERTGRGECRYALELDQAATADLVNMGPNAFHRSPTELSAQLAELTWPRTVTIAVAVSAWERR